MTKLIFSIFLLVLASSCATQTMTVDPSIKRDIPAAANPHFSSWSHFFVGGIGQSDFKNAGQMCKDSGGVAFVETRQSFGQVLVNMVTYGIYAPRTMNIYCNKD